MSGTSQSRAAADSEVGHEGPQQEGPNIEEDCPVRRTLRFNDDSTDNIGVTETTPGGGLRKNWKKLIKQDCADMLEKYSILANTKDLKRKIPPSEMYELLPYVLEDYGNCFKRMQTEIDGLKEKDSNAVARDEYCKVTLASMTQHEESMSKLIEEASLHARAFVAITRSFRSFLGLMREARAHLHHLGQQEDPAQAISRRESVPSVPTPAIGPAGVNGDLLYDVQGIIIDKCCFTGDGCIVEEDATSPGRQVLQVHLVLVTSQQDAQDAKGYIISDGYFFLQKDLTRLLHTLCSGKRDVKDLGQWARGPMTIPGHSIFSVKPGDLSLTSSIGTRDTTIDTITRAPKGIVFIRTDYIGTVLQNMCGTILNDKKVSRPYRDAIVERVHRVEQILTNFSNKYRDQE